MTAALIVLTIVIVCLIAAAIQDARRAQHQLERRWEEFDTRDDGRSHGEF